MKNTPRRTKRNFKTGSKTKPKKYRPKTLLLRKLQDVIRSQFETETAFCRESGISEYKLWRTFRRAKALNWSMYRRILEVCGVSEKELFLTGAEFNDKIDQRLKELGIVTTMLVKGEKE